MARHHGRETGIDLGLSGSRRRWHGHPRSLVASVSTLLILPAGLLAFGVAVLIDKDLSAPLRGLPLAATLAFLFGPALIAVLPESGERTVFIL